VKVIGHTVEVGSVVGVAEAAGGEVGVSVGALTVVIGVLVRVDVAEGTLNVIVAVLVRVAVAVLVTAVVGVALLQVGGEKVSFCPADKPPVLHSYEVNVVLSRCTPTVALDPLWVTVP